MKRPFLALTFVLLAIACSDSEPPPLPELPELSREPLTPPPPPVLPEPPASILPVPATDDPLARTPVPGHPAAAAAPDPTPSRQLDPEQVTAGETLSAVPDRTDPQDSQRIITVSFRSDISERATMYPRAKARMLRRARMMGYADVDGIDVIERRCGKQQCVLRLQGTAVRQGQRLRP